MEQKQSGDERHASIVMCKSKKGEKNAENENQERRQKAL